MITTASQLPPPPPPSDATLLAKLADVAEGELGVVERPPGSNRGPRVETYQAVCRLADAEPTGWPWCAAFVCWCVKQFISFHPGFLAAAIEANPPREASVYGLEDWGRRIGLHFSDDPHRPFTPQRGDLVFYRFSHVEIVRGVLPDRFETVGGNTNAADTTGRGGEVAFRTRSFQLARCFARLTPRSPQLPTPLTVVTR